MEPRRLKISLYFSHKLEKILFKNVLKMLSVA